MAIDIQGLNDTLLKTSKNYDEAVRKWVDLALAPAKDVPIKYYDQNGNLVQTAIPNRAKLFQNLLVNVNSAMNRTYYVDAVNGSDNNDGSSTAPFKTIKKAVDSVPVGGWGEIRLTAGQIHRIDADIYTANKTILFLTKGFDSANFANNAWIENVGYTNPNNASHGFIQRGGKMYFYYVNIRTANYVDSTKPLSIWEGLFKRWDLTSVNAYFFASIIELGDTDLIRTASGAHGLVDLYFYNCNIKQVGANRAGLVLLNEAGNYSVAQTASVITLQNGTAGTLNNLIGGQILATNKLVNF